MRMLSGFICAIVRQEVLDDCPGLQMGEAQDGVFECSEVVNGHASKDVGVAGFCMVALKRVYSLNCCW